jgi:hypothetical protein
LELKQSFAESNQMLHAFVTAGEQPLAGFVALDNGAGPAAEAGVAATGGTGINLEPMPRC